ncbi:MAG: hypothetical protein LBD97_02625 [Bifidobacteriaceae bacterium]|jgi:hypothetical protein|nr:hypothetical protein [Bifidobacteriaceae bacterium]
MALKDATGRLAAALAAAALATAALAGCDAQPGVAATVGDYVVTERELSSVAMDVDAVLEASGNTTGTDAQYLASLINWLQLRALAVESGDPALIAVLEPPTIEDYLEIVHSGGFDDAVAAALEILEPGETARWLLLPPDSTAINEAIYAALESGALTEEQLETFNPEVVVNPRYGEMTDAGLTPITPAWAVAVEPASILAAAQPAAQPAVQGDAG